MVSSQVRLASELRQFDDVKRELADQTQGLDEAAQTAGDAVNLFGYPGKLYNLEPATKRYEEALERCGALDRVIMETVKGLTGSAARLRKAYVGLRLFLPELLKASDDCLHYHRGSEEQLDRLTKAAHRSWGARSPDDLMLPMAQEDEKKAREWSGEKSEEKVGDESEDEAEDPERAGSVASSGRQSRS